MGAKQSTHGSTLGAKGGEQDLILSTAERLHASTLVHFQDAYGDEEGRALFRDVVGNPHNHQSDHRRLVNNLVCSM